MKGTLLPNSVANTNIVSVCLVTPLVQLHDAIRGEPGDLSNGPTSVDSSLMWPHIQ